MQVEVRRDGEQITIGTDETWRVSPARDYMSGSDVVTSAHRRGPRRRRTVCEVYDTRHKPVGWNVVGFDDSAWEDAFVISEVGIEPWKELVPREVPLLREWEVFPESIVESAGVTNARGLLSTTGGAAVVKPGRPAGITLDFGRDLVGCPVIRIRDSGPAAINLEYTSDDVAGHYDAPGRDMDRLMVHGGRREWQTFGRRAFRYLRLTFDDLESPLRIESVSANCVGCPVEQVSTFECSDEAVHALRLCTQDRFVDDPALGDDSTVEVSRLQALANYYCFFDTLLPREALRRFARSGDPGPAWVRMLHEYYLYTADRALVEELYPYVRRFAQQRLQCRLSRQRAGDVEATYHAIRDAAKLASAMGEIDDTVAWHDGAEAIMRRRAAAPRGEPQFYGEAGGRIAPAYRLPADILGIRPSIPESAVVIVQPRVGDLEWATGRIKTHCASVGVEWHFEPGRLTIQIEAPEGFILGLPIDRFRNPAVDEIDLSPDTPEKRAGPMAGGRSSGATAKSTTRILTGYAPRRPNRRRATSPANAAPSRAAASGSGNVRRPVFDTRFARPISLRREAVHGMRGDRASWTNGLPSDLPPGLWWEV